MNGKMMARSRLVGRMIVAFLLLSALTPQVVVAQVEEHVRVREEAMVELNAERWEEARVLLRQLYAIRPSGEALRLLGNTSYELRDYASAIDYLERSLTETTRPLSADNRILATDVLAAARRFVGTIVFAVLPDGAEANIQVEGTSESFADGSTLRLAAGRYTVTTDAPGYRRREAVLVVQSGVEQRYTIRLEPDAPATEPPQTLPTSEHETIEAARPTTARTAPIDPDSGADDAEGGSPAAGISLLVGGAAIAAVGVSFVLLGQADVRAVEGATSATWSDYEDRYDRGPRRTGIGIGLGVLGLATAVIGVTLIATRGDDQPALAVTVRTNGVALHGAF